MRFHDGVGRLVGGTLRTPLLIPLMLVLSIGLSGCFSRTGLDLNPQATRYEVIAFQSDRDGNWEIYTMDPHGGRQRRLTNNGAADTQPSIGRNGQIAFVSERDGNREIYIMNADGTDQRRLTNHPASDGSPAMSPTRDQIAFVSNREGNSDIYIMNTDGTGVERVTTNAGPDVFPTFSPDGNEIAFTSTRRDRPPQIYLISSTSREGPGGGGVRRRLTTGDGDYDPTFSSDGRWIAFHSDIFRDDPARFSQFYIHVQPVDDAGAARRLGNDLLEGGINPTFAPDGEWIAYSVRDQIHLVNVRDPATRRTLTTDGSNWMPSWFLWYR